MNIEDRLALVRQVGEEIVTEEELRALLESKAHPIAYDGFEPSGTIHIAQGLLRAINVNKMTKAGVRFKMFVADWHAWANNKMGGDLARIQTTGKYIVETWKASGMDLANVEFVWASEFVADEAYWKKVMNIARDSSLDRVLRTTQIMGRSEKDKLSAAQILYPCMQAADIFHLKADITQLGMDQRKVNMLAREAGPKLGFWKPVVVSHHMLMGLQTPPLPVTPAPEFAGWVRKRTLDQLRLALGSGNSNSPPERQLTAAIQRINDSTSNAPHYYLRELEKELKTIENLYAASQNPAIADTPENRLIAKRWYDVRHNVEGIKETTAKWISEWERDGIARATAMKMSKSNPDTAIFMTDSAADVERKLKKAYCPEKVAIENPVLEYARYIVFERFPEVTVERPEKFGGTVTFNNYLALEAAFTEGKLHPMDLKKLVATHINKLLDPVREHFEKSNTARQLKEQVEALKVTR